ncbi:hypothetical protein B1C78_03440 [Thioalkalivibrio denitrificans]|uniref:Uncharacterized protein n=2 Tax=Thioalkalivibrio denitrificans TaxID=108003 RepID=A0A1V3NSB8_9GAMM|nr:hypothetical protein B1C78_03440 [Thioalkalivibrio denitrificans]
MGGAVIHARDSAPATDLTAQKPPEIVQEIERVVSRAEERATLPLDLSRSDFERELSERYVGTHTLYRALSEQAQMEVYEHYQQDNRIESIRRVVAYAM